ncbi:MAG: hypothetical protein ACI9DH_000559 [Halioglobus sp.]
MISVRFENLKELRQVYDPEILEKATRATIKQLNGQAATLISKAIRDNYKIKAGDIKQALDPRISTQNGIPSGFLIYTSKRISLRHFSGGKPHKLNTPKVKTARGVRRGAKATITKRRGKRQIKGGFWGKGRAGGEDGAGEWQIFQRMGLSRLKVRKLTGPSISHMARGKAPLNAINQLVDNKASKLLENNLDHFIKRRAGIR